VTFTFVFDVDIQTNPRGGRIPETVVVHQEAEDFESACKMVREVWGNPMIRAAFAGRVEPLRGRVVERSSAA
jgi:hypothetical protein